MRRWVSSQSYKSAIEALVKARHQAGKTQREIATLIGKPPSFVAKVETGERRLDFVEFIVLARALGQHPETLLGNIARDLGSRVDI
ncbi:MAG: XRE family transcriptional regulator [Phenylobacterium sp.]|uniref:helix-turn-helix domain-containing protein n=1 Tax=Phenylobacterium sp. TaxID=1871053 RepID=UPI0012051B66|nr:helix-turn-helix transcriptional regulator [Phenylobacterium sp.]TAL32087.1 MAG: XRE family transcriptional regulator [Phenylobacterium sp.]